MAKRITIKCPNCGAEYMAAEIFYPNDFLGQPKHIFKDPDNGQILTNEGTDMNLVETYQCDHCNAKFKVEASVNFKTSAIVDVFDEEDNF